MPNLIRSNSYYNIFRPYLEDCQKTTYDTCPPVNLLRTGSENSNEVSKTPRTSSSQISFRAFNFNVSPFWQHQHHNVVNRNSERDDEVVTKSYKYCETTPLTPSNGSLSLENGTSDTSKVAHSIPLFEVLPPFMSSPTQSLLYQNSYLLDGFKYDYNSVKNVIKGKLSLDYLKFLKSIRVKSKPSDCDVIFGNAKILFNNSGKWNESRIDWLLELERRQQERTKSLHVTKQEADIPNRDKGLNTIHNNYGSDENFHLCCFKFGKKSKKSHRIKN